MSRCKFLEIQSTESMQSESKPSKLFIEYWQTDSKAYIYRKNTQHSQLNIEKEKQSQRTDITSSKTYYKATEIKTVWH